MLAVTLTSLQKSQKYLSNRAQYSLYKIYDWLKERKLNLNLSKFLNNTKNTTISTFEIEKNFIYFSSTKVFKDLRTFIAKNFKWNYHFNYLFRIARTLSF